MNDIFNKINLIKFNAGGRRFSGVKTAVCCLREISRTHNNKPQRLEKNNKIAITLSRLCFRAMPLPEVIVIITFNNSGSSWVSVTWRVLFMRQRDAAMRPSKRNFSFWPLQQLIGNLIYNASPWALQDKTGGLFFSEDDRSGRSVSYWTE